MHSTNSFSSCISSAHSERKRWESYIPPYWNTTTKKNEASSNTPGAFVRIRSAGLPLSCPSRISHSHTARQYAMHSTAISSSRFIQLKYLWFFFIIA